MDVKKLVKGFLVIAGYLYLPVLIFLPFVFITAHLNDFGNSIILLIVQVITTLIVLYYFRDSLKTEFQDFKLNYKKYLSKNKKYYIYGLIIMMLLNTVIALSGIVGGEIASNEATNRELLSSMVIFAIPTMIILAPICEEIVFRKAFKDVFNNKVVFVLFTGILFGAAHVVSSATVIADYIHILPYSSLGIAFSYIYIKTNNIFSSIVYHIIHNSLMILLLILAYVG